jgi:hypothetical protein
MRTLYRMTYGVKREKKITADRLGEHRKGGGLPF